jgi:AI-2 transport protein TqsA
METKRRNEQIWLAVGSLMIIAVVVLATGLIYTKVVMVPFVLAVFITIVVAPVVDFLVVRYKIPQSLALILALILVVAFLAVLVMFLFVAVNDIVTTANEYSDSFKEMNQKVFNWLKENEIYSTDSGKKITEELQQQMPAIIGQVTGTGAVLIANVVLIVFFVLFLLAGRNSKRVQTGLHKEIETAVRRYIVTKFVISGITGLMVWWILHIMGLHMAFVFGFLTFLLNFIPSIGSVIATLLPLPLAVAQFDGHLWPIIGVVAIPGGLQMAIGNALEPKLLGRGLELHPVTILLSLAFWGLLWGYMGMVLAVPITAIIRIILVHFETTRAIGNLLGGKLPGEDHSMSSLMPHATN